MNKGSAVQYHESGMGMSSSKGRAMRRPRAAVGSAVFFLVGPGIMAGLIPWLLTGWQVRGPLPYWAPMRVLGGCCSSQDLSW